MGRRRSPVFKAGLPLSYRGTGKAADLAAARRARSAPWPFRRSARLAYPWRRRRAAPSLEHSVDEFQDGALIGRRELLDTTQALQEPRGLGWERLAERLHTKPLRNHIGAD